MPERLYTEHPELYDAIQSDWDYDRDVGFVDAVLDRHEIEGHRLLEIGCGTGEHTRRFVDDGFNVTAVDKYDGMLDVAQRKCDADFRQMSLPNLDLEGEYNLIVAIRGVINHLPPDDLLPAMEAISARVTEGGVVIFDNSPLPPDGNHPAIDVGTTEQGDYARITQHVPIGDRRLDWRAITFTPDGEFFINSRPMTPFDDGTIGAKLDRLGFDVESHAGYGPGDHRTVFVAVA